MGDAAAATVRDVLVEPLSADAFAPYGRVLAAIDDGIACGADDAPLDLSHGRPRFYTMRLLQRGMTVRQITRHRRVTQVLASAGGGEWVIAVAPPHDVDRDDAEPALADIHAFRVPGDVAVMLHRGAWHAGPLFDGAAASFFNLELADTNLVDHQSCDLARRYCTVLRLCRR